MKRFGFALTVVALLAVGAQPQSNPATTQEGSKPAQAPRFSDQTYRVSVDLVNIFCSVYDGKTNAFVTTLTKDDFSVLEDGKKQDVQNFSREMNAPLTIALLIDTS